MRRFFLNRILAVGGFFGVLTVVGVAGYIALEGWSFLDSLYMTVITLTAVGYSEVHPLSDAGRNFTMVLLAGGITGMGLWFALLTSVIVELDLRDFFRRRRMTKEIEKMSGHVIVCGGGRTGRQVVEELRASKQPYVVIEHDPTAVEALRAIAPDARVVQADATVDHHLVEAGIARADGLITCLDSDTSNLFVCLSARDLQPGLRIVARARDEETVSKLFRAGANHVVSPTVSGAIHMASAMLRPSVVSFLDVATRAEDLALRMEQTDIAEGSSLVGKTLAEAAIPRATGLIVVALRKAGAPRGEFAFNPVADTILEAGDQVIVLGRPEQIENLRKYVR